MKSVQVPLCCKREAWEVLAREVRTVETPESLVRMAVALSLRHCPTADVDEVVATLMAMATEVRRRVRGTQQQAMVAHLHEYLFEELGYRGEATGEIFTAADGFLPEVMRRRRGSPILLSLVYVSVARWAGLNAWGIGLPGRFLAAIECGGVRTLVDPYEGGRMLTDDEARQMVEAHFGEEIEFTPDMLEPVNHRLWLTRMMQNLLKTFGAAGQYSEVGAMLEMEMILWPRQNQLQRDLALVLARLGRSEQAIEWLDSYLKSNPQDPQREDLEQLRVALKA